MQERRCKKVQEGVRRCRKVRGGLRGLRKKGAGKKVQEGDEGAEEKLESCGAARACVPPKYGFGE